MAGKRIDELREILAKAAARDADLERAMEALLGDLREALGGDERTVVWGEIKAGDGERQASAHFVLQPDAWLRGDLVVELAPEQRFVVSLMIRQAANGTHEIGLPSQPSQVGVLDPPDEQARAKARAKLFDHVFANLETQVRRGVMLRAE
jgi:hypothetical protein